MAAFNITAHINNAPLSSFQIRVFLICALVIFLDGIDYQIIGIVAPLVIKEFGVERSVLGGVFAAATLGAAIGSVLCGSIADRIGRKLSLVGAVTLLGLATAATALAYDISTLMIIRFITGLGLGGAVPCCVALTSEYAPARRRAAIVSLLWSAFPLGAMCGGFINAALIRQFEWRYLLYIWGFATLLVAVIVLLGLSESVRFLLNAKRPESSKNQGAVLKIVRQIGQTDIAQNTPVVALERTTTDASIGHLFDQGRIFGTVPLWAVMFIILGSLTVLASWSPALLVPLGFTPADAALIIGFNGLGSFLGAGIAGRAIERLGLLPSALPGFIGAALAALFYGWAGTASFTTLAAASVFAGFCLGYSSSIGLALAALVYPVTIRSTGIGCAMGAGRIGAVFGPLAVGLMVARGASMFQVFAAVSLALIVALPCIWALSRFGRNAANTQDEPHPVASAVWS